MSRMNTHLAAYVAGVIDSDGHISMGLKSVRGYPAWEYYAGITLTKQAFLEQLVSDIGIGKGRVRPNPRNLNPRQNQSFRVKWSMASCAALLVEIYPYLRLKKPQARLVLDFVQEKVQEQDNRVGSGRPYPQKIHDWGHKTSIKLHKLNKRGIDRQGELLLAV